MRVLLAKHFNSFRPIDEAGTELLRKIGQGEIVAVELKRPRNVQHHRLFFALLTLVWEQMDHDRYPTIEDLLDAVKLCIGHRRRIELPSGKIHFVPKSISFARMDQSEFAAFYDRVCDLIAREFLPGVTSADLRAEVALMIGVPVSATDIAA